MSRVTAIIVLVSLLTGLPLTAMTGAPAEEVTTLPSQAILGASTPARGTPDTLILVAGRARRNDPLQANIHHVTDTAYGLFRGYGYADDDISYLATDLTRPGADALPSAAVLHDLITRWASERTGLDAHLTLVLMNHGNPGLFYLDSLNGEQLTPDDLAGWLDLLAARRPDIRINVIIEAAYAGSFIAPPSPLSRSGRVIITSTSATQMAWASDQGAIFSDAFFGALGPDTTLNAAFAAGQWIVAGAGHPQYPWLDADGNGIPNEAADQALAGRVELFSLAEPSLPPTDEYEPDDLCPSASAIPTNGLVQEHTFERPGDSDWIRFRPITETIYVIEAHIPPGSPADLVLEVYEACTGAPIDVQDVAFAPGARVEFQASNSEPIYIRLHNSEPAIFGAQVSYQLSARGVDPLAQPGALIIMAARLGSTHTLQPNIERIGKQVYNLFNGHDYPDERITYLSSDPAQLGVDGMPTTENLQQALLGWAPSLVDANLPLTLYLIGDCEPDRMHLDQSAGQSVTPQELDAWLRQLEAERPGLKTNVVLEGCYAGSLLGLPHTLSAPGRLVIGATGSAAPAWASEEGAFFSDTFLAQLDQESSLLGAFHAAQWAAGIAYRDQEPWLDGDGDGIPNEPADATVAAQRGLPLSMTLCGPGRKGDAGPDGDRPTGKVGGDCAPSWPPYLAQGEIQPHSAGRQVAIRVRVLDDLEVGHVWARVYPPSYRAPIGCNGLAVDPTPVVVLAYQGSDWYGAVYDDLTEPGTHRVVFYAEDAEGLRGRPLAVEFTAEFTAGNPVYLPLVQN